MWVLVAVSGDVCCICVIAGVSSVYVTIGGIDDGSDLGFSDG